MAEKKEKELSFEENLEQLEEIVKKLELGDVPLDDAISEFNRAMKLAKNCDKKFEKIDSGRKRFRTIYKKKEIRESKLSNNEEDSIVNENSQGMSELI